MNLSEIRDLGEVEVAGGRRVKFGSRDHIRDIESLIGNVSRVRDKHKRGTSARDSYSRTVSRLKNELQRARSHAEKKRAKKLEECNSLIEGGAFGHLQHIEEDLDLTFAQVKEIITLASDGHLEKTTEKTDGINILFTYNVSEMSLRTARKSSDIVNGGMDAAALAQKFFGRGNIEEAFNTAFDVINKALSTLSNDDLMTVFGQSGETWYSMEIIYTKSPNTVMYDKNVLVIHQSPTFSIGSDGKVERVMDDAGVEILTRSVDKMQKAISAREWRVQGPAWVSLKKLTDGTVAERAISGIESAMADVGCNDENTLLDYLRASVRENVMSLGVSDDIAAMIIERCVEAPGALGIPQIKKVTPKPQQTSVVEFIKDPSNSKDELIKPIERVLHRFSIDVLKGVKSVLLTNDDEVISNLRSKVSKAINVIETSNSSVAMEFLHKELMRIGQVDDICTAIEGVVFQYNGQIYKLTGTFAPVNSLLGLFKFGRKGFPDLKLENRLISESGNAFESVGSITLDEYRRTYPNIRNDLMSIGCSRVEPVGSTGKKTVMGDIDLAVEFKGEKSELFDALVSLLGPESVKRTAFGASIQYPIDPSGSPVQVDIMVGNVDYMSWSRFGTTPDRSHSDYSPIKGAIKNMLMNTILRASAEKSFPGQQSEFDRTRYAVDFDRGLFKITQTKMGKTKPLKDWKTVDRQFISDDPDEIVRIILDDETASSKRFRTFEDVVRSLKMSQNMSGLLDQIFSTFIIEMKEFLATSPSYSGTLDPSSVIEYIEEVISSS